MDLRYREPVSGTAPDALVSLPDNRDPGVTGAKDLILVVDDEPAVVTVLRLVLEKSGFAVVVANDGREALSKMKEMGSHIRMIITDMAMPGMSGLEFIRAVRQFDGRVEIIATTGMTTPDQLEAIRGAGVHHVLSKPCGARQMLELVRGLIGKP